MDHPHRPDTDLLANRAAVGQPLAVLLEAVFLHDVAALAALHRLGACLQDVELSVIAGLAPLDVHRATVVLLDDHRVAGQLEHVGIIQREAVALGLGDIDGDRRTTRLAVLREHHLDQLGAEIAAHHRGLAQGQRRLMHVVLVRIDRTLHHGLAEAVGGGDEHHAVEARLGVHREHHAGCTDVRSHHALDAGRQCDLGMGEALVHPVGDRPIVVQRGKHLLDRVQDVLVAVDVQEGFLLTGERCVRQILGGRRRAHGETAFAFGGQSLVGRLDLALETLRKRRIDDPAPDFGAGPGQFIDIVDVQRFETSLDSSRQSLVLEELPIGHGRGCKATGHANAGRQLADHLAERRVLAADLFHVGHAQLFEGDDETGHGEVFRKCCRKSKIAILSAGARRHIMG